MNALSEFPRFYKRSKDDRKGKIITMTINYLFPLGIILSAVIRTYMMGRNCIRVLNWYHYKNVLGILFAGDELENLGSF